MDFCEIVFVEIKETFLNMILISLGDTSIAFMYSILIKMIVNRGNGL